MNASRALLLSSLALAGCRADFDPPSLVAGLRVLAVKAEPPELAAGEHGTLTALAVDPAGQTIALDWALCLEPPVAGSNALVNDDCVTKDSGDFLLPLGSGTSVAVTMPLRTSAQLGQPDYTSGFYVPVRVRARAGDATVTAIYRLRYHLPLPLPRNHNPSLAGLFLVAQGTIGGVPADGGAPDATAPDGSVPADAGSGAGDGGALPLASNCTPLGAEPTPPSTPPVAMALVEGTPLPVRAGDTVVLRALFTPGDDEVYPVLASLNPPALCEARELLTFSWYATGGTFSDDVTGEATPDTHLALDKHLPSAGGLIDVWLVGRDERGGTDFLHRALRLSP
jgi:hypothetical protein